VVQCISDVAARSRVVVTGNVTSAKTIALGASTAYECGIEDGTGDLSLVFVGRTHVPGLVSGAVCTAEGTARMVRGHLEIWNPLYELGPRGPNRS
jgi:DNA/RNA endonuclease YhcR with UshA esterase domain